MGGGVMLVTLLVRSENYGSKAQVRRCIWNQREKLGLFTRLIVKQKLIGKQKILGNVMRRDDQKCDVLKFQRGCEYCIKNNDDILIVSDEYKKFKKSY